ncbi:hypothetical protein [Eudoraea chungangensis]|uniref:hypothetical protein n=1 Tax=Eudoraea chungangensis TaxID=1481905 RepID=UPI0023ED860A|nr:hypothetical protein [Eudoraea chungangensis]
MNRKIKLIWDFRGLDALEIAKHHDKHLQEFIRKEELSLNISGHQFLNENHSIAFLVVEEKNMLIVRDALLPHRAEVFIV